MSDRSHLVRHWTRHAKTIAVAIAVAGPFTAAWASVGAADLGPAAALPTPCPVQAIAGAGADFGVSKSSAILGGGRSALDAMRAQQGISLLNTGQPQVFAETSRLTINLPGKDASLAPIGTCGAFVGSGLRPMTPGLAGAWLPQTAGKDMFLASQRVRIKRTAYDEEWQRVRSESFSRSAVRRITGVGGGDPLASLGAINAFVNRRIAYAEDRALFGRPDYWAGARRTLRMGKGDCEDIALLKMQLLAGAGVPREDMFLTITRDLARSQDHTVLIVRTGAGYRMLDDSTDAVLDGAPQHDYRAIISLGYRESWLHGA